MEQKINMIEDDNLEYCLFCYQENNLIKNELCQCIFFYDQKCYEKWFLKKTSFECIICKRKIDFKFIHYINERKNFIQNLQNRNFSISIRNRINRRENYSLNQILDVYFEYIWKVILILFVFLILMFLIIILLTMYIF